MEVSSLMFYHCKTKRHAQKIGNATSLESCEYNQIHCQLIRNSESWHCHWKCAGSLVIEALAYKHLLLIFKNIFMVCLNIWLLSPLDLGAVWDCDQCDFTAVWADYWCSVWC